MAEFLSGGVIPTGKVRIESFLEKIENIADSEVTVLAGEIASLSQSKLLDFVTRILPQTGNEMLLSLVFKSPDVHKKMGLDRLEQYMDVLLCLNHSELISQEFFEECATSLLSGYENKRNLNFLPRLHVIYARSGNAQETVGRFKSPSFDLAMAKHLASVLPYGQSNNEFIRSWDSLKRVELPATLEVFLQAKMDVSVDNVVSHVVADLFAQDKLSESYIAVCRRVMGDALFLDACMPYMSEDRGIHSVAKLVPIFGEATFHTPSLFSDIRWSTTGDGLPAYVNKFHEFGFDEATLPLLASYVLDNLESATKFNSSQGRQDFIKNLARLAVRNGKGEEALRCYVNNINGLAYGKTQDSPSEVIDALCRSKRGQQATLSVEVAYKLLTEVIEIVGVESLHAIAPEVNDRFICELADRKGGGLSRKSIMTLFPQVKGRLLESDLGL